MNFVKIILTARACKSPIDYDARHSELLRFVYRSKNNNILESIHKFQGRGGITSFTFGATEEFAVVEDDVHCVEGTKITLRFLHIVPYN